MRGSPEPRRDLFVHKDTSDKNLREYVSSKGIVPLHVTVTCVPIQTQSLNLINKLTVSQCDSKAAFNADIWPEGIRIRKFYIPKNKKMSSTNKPTFSLQL